MIFSAWRITKRKHQKIAFTGDGARRFGGRWNNPGIPVVYTAQSQSLAVLEMLVHLDSPQLLEQYVLFEVEIDSSLVTSVEPGSLPRNWRDEPPPPQVQAIGDEWTTSGTSAALRVPSALLPSESNFLLNPRHGDFARLRIGRPIPFRFDARLRGKR